LPDGHQVSRNAVEQLTVAKRMIEVHDEPVQAIVAGVVPCSHSHGHLRRGLLDLSSQIRIAGADGQIQRPAVRPCRCLHDVCLVVEHADKTTAANATPANTELRREGTPASSDLDYVWLPPFGLLSHVHGE
jgi:hypothetical protein